MCALGSATETDRNRREMSMRLLAVDDLVTAEDSLLMHFRLSANKTPTSFLTAQPPESCLRPTRLLHYCLLLDPALIPSQLYLAFTSAYSLVFTQR